ncbi:MAG TPA: hypothetical protein VE267_20410, partial [Bradyrhizobium sp.]|nr:hypothetical protein [Bradyrhizobium sp.]
MTPTRLGLVVLSVIGVVGCSFIGAPERASDTQNLNAISDDISALTFTQSDVLHAADPLTH